MDCQPAQADPAVGRIMIFVVIPDGRLAPFIAFAANRSTPFEKIAGRRGDLRST
jgi:hypothetical protein